jgi:hypothetical protein
VKISGTLLKVFVDMSSNTSSVCFYWGVFASIYRSRVNWAVDNVSYWFHLCSLDGLDNRIPRCSKGSSGPWKETKVRMLDVSDWDDPAINISKGGNKSLSWQERLSRSSQSSDRDYIYIPSK